MDILIALAIDTLIFTVRVLAASFSMIGFANYIALRGKEEFPPYDRKRNERAWNWAYAGMIIGGVSFVALDMNYKPITGHDMADLFVAAVWWCWANAVTVRLSSKAARPFYVYLAASVFIVGGFTYAFATAP